MAHVVKDVYPTFSDAEVGMRVGLVLFPDFQMMSLAAMSVFELANEFAAAPLYELATVSEDGGPVRGSAGFEVMTQAFAGLSFDTLLIGGGVRTPSPTAGLTRWLQERPADVRRIGGICTGAFVLAAAGLLDGRRATTHWSVAKDLQSRFATARVEEDRIFVTDGPIWTSAGMSAGFDLALAMVEDDHGADLARGVARRLVLYHRRGGGQRQHSELLELAPKSDRIHLALSFARANLADDLSVERLAAEAALSPRQFSRTFVAETGQSPAKAVERLRVEAARRLIEDSRQSVEAVAKQVGFGDPERMRRAFVRVLGRPPQLVRRMFRSA